MLYSLARRALFTLDAEHAHELSLQAFRRFPVASTMPFASQPVDDPVDLMGLRFANRVGLAAGLDKNGECLKAWAQLGFGFVEVGTVTPRPQPGNPRPRMFRLPAQRALINRLGFNNKGVDYLISQVERSNFNGVLGINIGKNADTPIVSAVDDYIACLRKVHAPASYITVNISSPNTKNLRELQGDEQLNALLNRLAQEREVLAQAQGKRTPMLVKIAPDVDDVQIEAVARAALEHGVDGLIASNTTVTRPGLDQSPIASETGGLSGAPLRVMSTDVLRKLRQHLDKKFVLIGVGGICSADDASEKISAGADLVQVYSGFIYEGPGLIRSCAEALSSN